MNLHFYDKRQDNKQVFLKPKTSENAKLTCQENQCQSLHHDDVVVTCNTKLGYR